jgi:hypothetical protein
MTAEVQLEEDVARLDDMLALLAEVPPSAEVEKVQEHIQGARNYLLGSMPVESDWNLELARHAARYIPDRAARAKVHAMLADLHPSGSGAS